MVFDNFYKQHIQMIIDSHHILSSLISIDSEINKDLYEDESIDLE